MDAKWSGKWTTVLAGLVVLVVIAVVILLKLLPRALEAWLEESLTEKGWQVEALPVEQAGLTRSRLAKGAVRRGPLLAEWTSVTVEYSPWRLPGGELDGLLLEQPVIIFQLPDPAWSSDPPKAGLSVAEPGHSKDVPQRAGDLQTDPTLPETPKPEDKRQSGLHALFQQIPFREMEASGGSLQLLLPGGNRYTGTWNAGLIVGPDLMNGFLFFESGSALATAVIQGIKSAGVFTVQTDAEIQPGPVLRIARGVFGWGANGSSFPEFRFTRPLELDILSEFREGQDMKLSAEARLEEFSAKFPGLADGVEVSSVMAIMTHQEMRTTASAGIRLKGFEQGRIRMDPFALQLTYESDGEMQLESEQFSFFLGGWSAVGALRGSATFGMNDGGIDGRVEYAFSSLEGSLFRIEPASLLMSGNPDSLEFRFSPLGLKRATTVWLEEVRLNWSRAEDNLVSGFKWFNSAGALMGSMHLEGTQSGNDGISARIAGQDADGGEFLSGSYRWMDENHAFSAEGSLPLDWMNAIGRWWGGMAFNLSGNPPRFKADLAGKGLFLKGWATLKCEALVINLTGGPLIEGIESDIRFLMNGFPQSDGTQSTRIRTVTTGDVRLEDVLLEWSMPTYRVLKVERLVGRVGGGQVEVEPFTVDTADPTIPMNITFTGLDSGSFLDWLGEKRFAIEGSVSGKLTVVWKDDVIHVGSGSLQMVDSPRPNRFLFADQEFLEDQFSSISGVPEEISGRLLEALLREGIRIDDLRLELLPLKETSEVSLRLTVSGETRTEEIVVPIEGLIINNLIPEEDLGRLLGLVGPIRFLETP